MMPESGNPVPATLPLLVELGCEEIPARFLSDARMQFGERLDQALEEAHLLRAGEATPLQTYSTPRRLIAFVAQILQTQLDKVEELIGPPAKIAFDANGAPTRAGESFAAKNGVKSNELLKVSTPKGDYVAVRKTTPGRPALDLLAEIIPSVIECLNFPKSMYWLSKSGPRFVRPIRWTFALLGADDRARTVQFEFAGVRASDRSYGHRVLGGGPLVIRSFAEYAQKLRANGVEFDPAQRRRTVDSQVKEVLDNVRLRIVPDPELEQWIVNSTEWPYSIMGRFEERFLALPREILITVMRDHQKYFAVEDEKGNLQPRFVTVLNVDGDRDGVIRRGHERVLRARFSDAEFFWNADQKIPLRDRLSLLEKVTYQAKLGSYADKVRRMQVMARALCEVLQEQGSMTLEGAAAALRAVELSKCDLTTQMVQEFTELQGVVGGLYASAQGEAQEVSDSIYDQYKPVNLEDERPRSLPGAVLSVVDKLDSIVAGFSVGLQPTGSSDPFGLRRAGNGVIKVMIEVLPSLDLLELLRGILDPRSGLIWAGDVYGEVARFLRERVEFYLEEIGGLRRDTIRAVAQSHAGWSPPARALQRGLALERIRDTDDFLALSTAAKRTRNILEKSATASDRSTSGINEALLSAGPERSLYEAFQKAQVQVRELESKGDYAAAFLALATLRPTVDSFFDSVLVMDPNVDIKSNRLRLLDELRSTVFSYLADLSQVAPETSSKTVEKNAP